MLLLNPIENDCYFLRYDHGKLDLRFVDGRAEKCIRNGAHILGQARCEEERWNFRQKGDGRSGPLGYLLPERNLTFWCT